MRYSVTSVVHKWSNVPFLGPVYELAGPTLLTNNLKPVASIFVIVIHEGFGVQFCKNVSFGWACP